MQATPENLGSLRGLLLNSLSGNNALRKEAEQVIAKSEGLPGFTVCLLQLISALSTPAASAEDTSIRQSAAALFKNVTKRRWKPSEEEDASSAIAEADRETIKTHLVELLCSSPTDVQKQLAEAVAVVAKHDFPERWTGLLPQMVAKLGLNDLNVTKGVMLTVNSIMKRFRYAYKTDALMAELILCLKEFQAPLLLAVQSNAAAIEALAANRAGLGIAVETHTLICRIYFSLNWQDIPEFFEDNIGAWMEQFAKCLQYQNPLLVDEGESSEAGPIERMQAAVVENISLYATKYEEEFNPYLSTFTQLVWQRLMAVGPEAKFDILATSLIKYLTSVCSKEMNISLFTDAILSEIVSNIVVRNLTATEMDEELFEENPTDYIRKDMEGSDQDTRRRCAVELVRGLQKFFGEKVSHLCIGYIGSMLETYRATLDWRSKDAALHLVLAVSVKATANQAASDINPLINILDIFQSHVLPEIHDAVLDARPIVKADAIKMVCLFRQQFPTPFLLELLPHIVNYLQSRHVVVQTYAAVCIEKFLSVKDRDASGALVQRITIESLRPYMQPLLAGLFAVLENPDLPENDYVMKSVMRALAVCGSEIGPLTELVLHKLTVALDRVCKNPINPHFNHYLFECVALLIRSSCLGVSPEATATACNKFEGLLFPPFQIILQQDVTEFTPYVFQILAQLLSYRPGAASDAYKALFPPLLSPTLWERRGNVPALSDLFRAYISKSMPDILAGGHLMGVLGVFQKLLASKATEVFSFKLLDNLIQHCPTQALAPYTAQIFNLLLVRMQEERTPRFCKMFVHSMCLFSCSDAPFVYKTVESIEAGLVRTLITKVWGPNGPNCAGGEKVEVRHMVVGATKMLCSTDVSTQLDLWGAGLKFVLCLLSQAGAGGEDETYVDEEAEAREFDSTYSRLAYAQFPDGDLTAEMAAAPAFFATSLDGLCRARPGTYGPVLAQLLDGPEREALQAILVQAGVSALN